MLGGAVLHRRSQSRHPVLDHLWLRLPPPCLPTPCQSRKPPLKALLLSPSRASGGSDFSNFVFPPPSTTYSASSAVLSCSTTSNTCRRHLFLPNRFRPRIPT